MRGRKNQDKPRNTNILPPCQVCGEPGTGFHYGVTSCGACKGFFRRSIVRREPYECVRNDLCDIGPSTSRRESCPKCRYDKCLAVGMSKDAIKIGRYSLVKKSNYAKQAIVTSSPPRPQSYAPSTFTNGQETTLYQQPQTPRANETSGASGTLLDSPLIQEQIGNFAVFTDSCVTKQKSVLPYTNGNSSLCFRGQDNADNKCHNVDSFLDFLMDGTNSNAIDTGNCDMDASRQGHENDLTPPTYTVLESSTSYSSALPWRNSNTDQSTDLKFGSPVFQNDNDFDCKLTGPVKDFSSTTTEVVHESCVQQTNGIGSLSDHTLTWDMFQSLQLTNNNSTLSNVTRQHMQQTPLVTNESSSSSFGSLSYPMGDHDVSSHNISYNTIASSNTTTPTVSPQPDIYSNQVPSCCSSTNGDLDNQNNLKEPARNDILVSAVSKKKHFNERDEDESSTKKPRVSEIMEPDSSRSSTPEKNNALVPVLKDNKNTQPKPLTFQIVAPSSLKFVVSMFECFPFRSFERQSLAPILKMCYDATMDCSLGGPLAQKKPIRYIGDDSQRSDAISTFTLKATLPSAQSSDEPTCAKDLTTFDAAGMEGLYEFVHANHCRYYGPKSAYMSDYERELAMETYSKICRLQDSLLGAKDWVDDDKYFAILESTGIDVDKRREWFAYCSDNFDTDFTMDVKFIRALPGFKDLTLNDRTLLTKTNFIFYMKLRQFRTTDFERDVCIDEESGIATRLSVLRRIVAPISDVMDLWKQNVKDMKDLDISFEELIILKCVFFLTPDFCKDLENPELVRHWHNTYLKCLLHLLRRTHGPEADARFDKIFEFVQKMKGMERPMKKGRRLATDTISRLTAGHEKPLFTEIFINLPF